MNRRDIVNSQPEGVEDIEEWMKDVLDHFEEKFNEIKSKLDIQRLSDLDQIEDAYNIADKTAGDLY